MNGIIDLTHFSYMRNHFDWELFRIFVHICQYFVVLNSNWVDDVFKVLLFLVEVAEGEVESGGLQDVHGLVRLSCCLRAYDSA